MLNLDTIYNENCLDTLSKIPDGFINCCVTSPPYWGLRDYKTGTWEGGDSECKHLVGNQVEDNKAQGAISMGIRPWCNAYVCKKCGAVRIDEQIGLEATPEEYVTKIVKVFREVRRVLKDDGTLWLNLGDSYASRGGANPHIAPSGTGNSSKAETAVPARTPPAGLKPKDLVGIPWRVAFALQEDGWYLRSDMIWYKPNVMPESVTDRPTRSHEYIFLLSKNEKYYYDNEAIKERSVSNHKSGNGFKRDARLSYLNSDGSPRGNDSQWTDVGGLRNKRSVWTINTKPFKGAHFAVFPESLIEPCILAGCAEGGGSL